MQQCRADESRAVWRKKRDEKSRPGVKSAATLQQIKEMRTKKGARGKKEGCIFQSDEHEYFLANSSLLE